MYWHQIRLGQDGVIVRKGTSGWDLERFLNELCVQKAGLPADCYKDDPRVSLSVFQAQVFE